MSGSGIVRAKALIKALVVFDWADVGRLRGPAAQSVSLKNSSSRTPSTSMPAPHDKSTTTFVAELEGAVGFAAALVCEQSRPGRDHDQQAKRMSAALRRGAVLRLTRVLRP